MIALVLAMFLAGYTSMVSLRGSNMCHAQAFLPPPVGITVTPGTCSLIPVGFGACVDLCDPVGTSTTVRTTDENVFDQLLQNLTDTLPPWMAKITGGGVQNTGGGDDGFIGGMIDVMMNALLVRLNDTELDMIDWWDTMWYYNLRPAMQAMTRQLNTSTAQQTEDFQSGMDAFQEDQTNMEAMQTENKNHQTTRVSEPACVAATASGGMGRVTSIARGMRQGWQDDIQADGTNRRYTSGTTARPSAAGAAAKLQRDSATFESTFCDPNDNGGHNVCAGPTPVDKYGNSYANADTQVTKNLYNKLTMQVDDPVDGPNEAKVAKAVVDNTMGDPTGDPMPVAAMASPQGQELWLQRRSFLARYGAIRSVPQLIAGWRMPGSKLGQWIKELRTDAGVPTNTGEMSDNPSYREIVHAISIDRFNSGKYANNMISDDGEIEMEKLTLSSFYLMQLRDYYELLEREALTLAVQVSMMADKLPLPDHHEIRPIRP
ncbi:MAG: hypothetical protein ACAH83_13855 [Alphaproteobacteria bacterium]